MTFEQFAEFAEWFSQTSGGDDDRIRADESFPTVLSLSPVK